MPIKLNLKGRDELKRLVTGLEVAIIDPLRPLVCGDWMKPADASNFLENLREVQNDTGTTIILVHHIRKPDRKIRVLPENLQFEIKGATEYVDGAATVLLLDRPRNSRDESGLPTGTGPYKIITDMAVMDFEPVSKRMRVFSLNPGFLFEDVQNNCGFELLKIESIENTPPPGPEELKVLREEVDPYRYVIGR